MALLTRDESLDVARRVVDASPADETEVTLDSEVDSFVRFADVGPTQSADRERVCLAIRVRQRGGDAGYREARAACAFRFRCSFFGCKTITMAKPLLFACFPYDFYPQQIHNCLD